MVPAFLKKNKIFSLLSGGGKDLGLAIGIIIVLIMIVAPVPSYVLDAAICINLAFSLIFIITAIYVPSIVKIASFPATLLLVTAYRLALHVAASRLILTKGYAGKVILTFGKYAAGGNYVVGAVVFIVITILQFLVIVKGSERISEVAARFALDAMPGKQMSIEADMRAGTLNAKTAREKRAEVQQESQLFGSMDGALKFVKGDAIAGLIVAVVNILGGIITGMILYNLPALEAGKKYVLLTIGEGLSSQVSALLVSVAAGMIITKVASTEKEKNQGLAAEIIKEMFKLPTPMLLSGFFIFSIGFVPGMPWYIFAPMGAGLFYFGFKGSGSTQKAEAETGLAFKDAKATGHAFIEGDAKPMSKIVPVILEAGNNLSSIILNKSGEGIGFMEDMIPKMRVALYDDTGVSFPGIHVNVNNNLVRNDEYIIILNEIPGFNGKIFLNHILTNESKEVLERYKIPVQEFHNSLGMPSCWVPARYATTLKQMSVKTWTIAESVTLALSLFYKNNSESFVGVQETKGIIAFAEQDYPDLVKECIRLLPVQKIAEIFKRLIAENISIKNIRSIFEAIVENAQTEKSPSVLVEYIREYMHRYITYKATRGQPTASVYIVDPNTEDLIRSNIKETTDGSYLSLSPEYSNQIINSAQKVIKQAIYPPVIVTTMDIRRFVYKIVSRVYPNIIVISYQELSPNVETKPIGTISI